MAKVTIENAKVRWMYFPSEDGKRSLNVILSEEQKQIAEELGLNIKYNKPRNEGDDIFPSIKLIASYRFSEPDIFLVRDPKKKPVKLTEDTIDTVLGSLSASDIDYADVIFTTSAYDNRGNKGVSAYIQTMYVVAKPNPLANKWEKNWDDPDNEVNLETGISHDDLPF